MWVELGTKAASSTTPHTRNHFKNRAIVSSSLGKFINDCGWLSTSPTNKLVLKIDTVNSEQGIIIPNRRSLGRESRRSRKLQDTSHEGTPHSCVPRLPYPSSSSSACHLDVGLLRPQHLPMCCFPLYLTPQVFVSNPGAIISWPFHRCLSSQTQTTLPATIPLHGPTSGSWLLKLDI